MKKGFTLIELVVAVSLLAMVFLFAGIIFKVSIDSYRTSDANAEIMRKLRAVTDQLSSDFEGIQADAPLLIWFERDTNDPNRRFDQIMFFAAGDFQSFQLYGSGPDAVPDPDGNNLVIGSVARIFYGQAQPAPNLLARRRHILADDDYLDEWPSFDFTDFNYLLNEWYEHDSLSLAQWKLVIKSTYDSWIVPNCFDNVGGSARPEVDMTDPNTFHKLMCEGVGSFAIQWAYWDSGDLKWFPIGSDFTSNPFGIYFNIPGPGSITDWDDGITVADNVYPRALKFTFRLYDSKGIIKEDGSAGRTFTHIIYLDN